MGAECNERLERTPGLAATLPVHVVPDAPGGATPANCAPLDGQALAHPDTNPDRQLRREVIGSSTLCLVFTSGTTGLPKAARITHARWLGVGEGWTALLGLGPDDVLYCVLPLYHVAALMSLMSNAMACGGSVVLRRRFSASGFWRDVRSHGVTVAQYSGEMCRYLFNRPPSPEDRDHRLRVMTGSGLSPAIWQAFQDRFGVAQMIEGYGGTEINVGLMNLENRIGSCGRIPFPERSNARLVRYDRDNDCYVRNPDGTLIECVDGEVGEMLGMILELPGVTGGRFDGYTDREATGEDPAQRLPARGRVDAQRRPVPPRRRGLLLLRRPRRRHLPLEERERLDDRGRERARRGARGGDGDGLRRRDSRQRGPRRHGHRGDAGGGAFDPAGFHRLARERLASYAVPVFVRVRTDTDITATFKLRKVDLQKLGYAPAAGDELYVADTAAQSYVPLTSASLARLGIPSWVAMNGDDSPRSG